MENPTLRLFSIRRGNRGDALNPNQNAIRTAVRCPNCKALLIVYIAARQKPIGADSQTVVCVRCNRAFLAMLPDKIVGGPFFAPEN